MKKILIGTPYRDEFTVRYLNGLVASVTDSALAKDYKLVPTVTASTYVQTARNEMANKAVREAFDEVVFVDSDIGWHPEALARLLSHDVDIVGADYCKRVAGPEQPTARAKAGSKPREDGLQEASCVPAGFLRIKTRVFRTMWELLPQRRYRHEGKEAQCEYFPVGLTEKGGWRHPAEVRLDMIEDAFVGCSSVEDVWTAVKRALYHDLPELPEITGEDVAFCRLADQCGFTVWCDVTLKLRHYGVIGFPAVETPM